MLSFEEKKDLRQHHMVAFNAAAAKPPDGRAFAVMAKTAKLILRLDAQLGEDALGDAQVAQMETLLRRNRDLIGARLRRRAWERDGAARLDLLLADTTEALLACDERQRPKAKVLRLL